MDNMEIFDDDDLELKDIIARKTGGEGDGLPPAANTPDWSPELQALMWQLLRDGIKSRIYDKLSQ
jgi:hypothetical protein